MFLKYLDLSKEVKRLPLALSNLGMQPVFALNNSIHEYDILCCGYANNLYYRDRYKEVVFDCIKKELERTNPKAFILENSTWLYEHTSDIEKLGYVIYYKIFNAINYGLYKSEGSIFIVGFNKKKIDTTQPFEFPNTQNLKQLGNSGYVDVVQHVASSVEKFLSNNIKDKKSMTLNKGEWSEFFAFLKMISKPKVYFGNEDLEVNSSNDYVTVYGLQHIGSNKTYILDNHLLKITDGKNVKVIGNIQDIISNDLISEIKDCIVNSTSRTFDINQNGLLELLDIQSFKGDSQTKPDINVSYRYQEIDTPYNPWGIKSFLGSCPTLLNAGFTTNFVYEVTNFNGDMNMINNISTRSKIKDRIKAIHQSGSILKFSHCENQIFHENLRKTDSSMPEYLSNILIKYYSGLGTNLKDLIDTDIVKIRVTDFLKAVLLGMFSSKPWDGNYSCNGLLVIRPQGDLLLYHVIKDSDLKDYLFKNTRLDTASSSRHEFGSIYQEKDDKYYFKLNLQIRNK